MEHHENSRRSYKGIPCLILLSAAIIILMLIFTSLLQPHETNKRNLYPIIAGTLDALYGWSAGAIKA